MSGADPSAYRQTQGKLTPDSALALQDKFAAHLLSQAATYCQTQPGGSVQVRFSFAAGRVVLSVTDNGQGITREHLKTVFNMFTRGRETEETQGGLGVGLALVKMLVDKHSGTLKVHSDGVGRGATFTLSCPLHR
jgi:two-component system CheB/CheR fusion protein